MIELPSIPEPTDIFGLSETSRLNKRYQQLNNKQQQQPLSPEDLEMESISQRGGTRDKWDDIGLSKTPLNERYFSQPDLADKADGEGGRAALEEDDRRRFSESRARSQVG